jgi:hypothetical protein
MRLWIKNPLAIVAESGEGGLVVCDSKIAELMPWLEPRDRQLSGGMAATFLEGR